MTEKRFGSGKMPFEQPRSDRNKDSVPKVEADKQVQSKEAEPRTGPAKTFVFFDQSL
jgi:hypothetical protein